MSTQVSETKFDRYNHSPKGYARNVRYNKSEKRKVKCQQFYARHGGWAAYQRERYHRKQEEAGCHKGVRDFYPVFLFLQSLADAEVVEV